MVRALKRLADAGQAVLLLTGDVHWGRITKIEEGGRARFYENLPAADTCGRAVELPGLQRYPDEPHSLNLRTARP